MASHFEVVVGRHVPRDLTVIVDVWECYKAVVDQLDAEVADPFSDDAIDWMRQAAQLTGHDAYRLSFWLSHIADAIAAAA